jgi:hypothetical protein
MEKIFALTLFAFFSLQIVAYAESFGPKHAKVAKFFQSNQEPVAKDAIWTAKDIFKVGVIDDGSRRDGYAQYICEVLYDEGFNGHKVWVQVIDIVKLTRNGSWVKLGEAHCQ